MKKHVCVCRDRKLITAVSQQAQDLEMLQLYYLTTDFLILLSLLRFCELAGSVRVRYRCISVYLYITKILSF